MSDPLKFVTTIFKLIMSRNDICSRLIWMYWSSRPSIVYITHSCQKHRFPLRFMW